MHRTIIAILLISLVPISVDAQTPSPEVNWTAGWEIEDDVAVMQLDSLSYNFELTLNFWINNNRLTPIEVGFETSFENVEFDVDDPGTVSVSGNSNETYELKISGSGMASDGILYNADEFSETITLQLIELIAGQAADSSREISMDLEFSEIYNLDVEYEVVGLTSSNAKISMKSGTSETMNVRVFNFGNTQDAVKKTSISVSKCPQLDYSFETTSALPIAINPAVNQDDSSVLGELIVSTANSHPTKECTLELTIHSESDGSTSYAGLVINVESVENEQDGNNDDTEDSSSTESTEIEVESSSLPAISSVLCMFTMVFCAIIRRE